MVMSWIFTGMLAISLLAAIILGNGAALAAAVTDVNVLLDKQAAAEVQAMIDTIKDLGEITLEHKDRIAEIRAAYNGVDYALYSEFESKEALTNYATHPAHLAAKEHFWNFLNTRVCADYEV